jgi:hypothetical protein
MSLKEIMSLAVTACMHACNLFLKGVSLAEEYPEDYKEYVEYREV